MVNIAIVGHFHKGGHGCYDAIVLTVYMVQIQLVRLVSILVLDLDDAPFLSQVGHKPLRSAIFIHNFLEGGRSACPSPLV